VTAFGLAFLVSIASCALLSLVLPVPAEPFERHMSRRLTRMGGRACCVFAVVAVGAGVFGAFPPTVLAGAVAGWLLPSVQEWRRFAPRFENVPHGNG